MAYMRQFKQDLLRYDPSKAYNGYTLFAPMSSNDAWLIDMEGSICHHWTTPFPPAQHGKLLPNGNLLWPQKAAAPIIPVGGTCSEIIELDWDGNVVWKHEDPVINHDFVRLENGNTLFNRYVKVDDDLAKTIQGGVPDSEAEGEIWDSALREVDKDGNTVWEWVMHEHIDPVEDAQCPCCPRSIWGYINSVFVMKDGNVLCTFRFQNEVAIIDKATGDVVWRWGKGRDMGHPHCVSETDAGTILIFDNGVHRRSIHRGAHELSYSRILEVDRGTNEVIWEYHAPNVFDFYSSICGGCKRLPNGNTIVCESTKGRFFELTPEKEIVWEYQNPFLIPRSDYWGWTMSSCVFQCHRYAPDFPGLAGKDLDPAKFVWPVQIDETRVSKKQTAFDRLERLGY